MFWEALKSTIMGNNSSGEDDECETENENVSVQILHREPSPFDDFEFGDLSPAARAMFVDRKHTHSFQVRGPTYLKDKKKMHPGPAICKLMLLELYEVEPKDGDRHDHVASRGLARKRVETIAALPGSPFQLVINFQIPGDPPVSLFFVILFSCLISVIRSV